MRLRGVGAYTTKPLPQATNMNGTDIVDRSNSVPYIEKKGLIAHRGGTDGKRSSRIDGPGNHA